MKVTEDQLDLQANPKLIIVLFQILNSGVKLKWFQRTLVRLMRLRKISYVL